MPELTEIPEILRRMGTDSAVLTDSQVADVVASGLDLLSQQQIPSVTIRSESLAQSKRDGCRRVEFFFLNAIPHLSKVSK
jgi:hypothetical protein